MSKKTLIHTAAAVLILLLTVPAFSTPMNAGGPAPEAEMDSIDCRKYISIYREFYRIKLFEEAIIPWRVLFDNCPDASEKMYVEGVQMYRSFIENDSDPVSREGKIDTLMLIYDRRMENFGGEGNVLGRKGRDLLNYRRDDMDQVRLAYDMLKRSIELEGRKSSDAVMILFVSSSLALNNEGMLEDDQSIEDYLMVSEILAPLQSRGTRWKRAKASVDENILKSGILTCEALNRYYEPKFEANRENREFLEQVITFYTSTGCDRANVYVAASEFLYAIEPGPQSAHNLAILFIGREDYTKAIDYLKEALQGDDLDPETRADWYYELAVVTNANGNTCEAIEHVRAALSQKNNLGKAWILLGDLFIASRDNLGDDFQKRTAFWAAADAYKRAAEVDPAVSSEANQKLADYAGQYPNNEEVFFRDLKDGDPYQVEGCINERTTVRSRK